MFNSYTYCMLRSFWVTASRPNRGRSFQHWRASMIQISLMVPTEGGPRVERPSLASLGRLGRDRLIRPFLSTAEEGGEA